MKKSVALGIGTALLIRQTMKYIHRPQGHAENFNYRVPPDCYSSLQQSAIFSAMAYEDPEGFDSFLNLPSSSVSLLSWKPEEPTDVLFFDSSLEEHTCHEDTQAYLWIRGDIRCAFIVFRGTEDVKDAFADLDIRHVELGLGKGLPYLQKGICIHRGFYEQFEVVSHDILTELQSKHDSYDSIYISGHSLGGALATIAAAYYGHVFKMANKQKVVHCHTFGSPRVGNKQFCEWFKENVNGNHWRVFNHEDPVSMVPMGPRFEHVHDKAIRIGDDGCHDIYTGDVGWLWRPLTLLVSMHLVKPIGPHSCKKYIDALEGMKLLSLSKNIEPDAVKH